MKKRCLAALVLCAAGAAQAQDSGLSVSAGLKAWNAQWTTWGYFPLPGPAQVVTQELTEDKLLLFPVVGVRYREFIASFSGIATTTFDYPDGDTVRRNEYDVNIGWAFAPGVAATLGYKRLAQKAQSNNYELSGPTIGLSATAPLSGSFSMYGALGLGRLKPTGNVDIDADYQLSEVGFAYNLAMGGLPKALTFTFGYRMQVLKSKEALGTRDARDLTQGFTFGALASF